MPPPSPILSMWEYVVPHVAAEALRPPSTAWIPPDGCQDWIGIAPPGSPTQWHVFALASRAQTAQLLPGSRMRGWRLAPGAHIHRPILEHAGHLCAFHDAQRIEQLLQEAVTLPANTDEALRALATSTTVQQAAHQLGIHLRTLERHLFTSTQQSPKFWHSLARVRQACRSLQDPSLPLAEVAAHHGYSDQSHMNLAFRHWMGCTPKQLRSTPAHLALACAEGFG